MGAGRAVSLVRGRKRGAEKSSLSLGDKTTASCNKYHPNSMAGSLVRNQKVVVHNICLREDGRASSGVKEENTDSSGGGGD